MPAEVNPFIRDSIFCFAGVTTCTIGYPRIGPDREMKKALEKCALVHAAAAIILVTNGLRLSSLPLPFVGRAWCMFSCRDDSICMPVPCAEHTLSAQIYSCQSRIC